MKMKTVVKLKASAECPSHSKADIAIRDLNLMMYCPVSKLFRQAGTVFNETWTAKT